MGKRFHSPPPAPLRRRPSLRPKTPLGFAALLLLILAGVARAQGAGTVTTVAGNGAGFGSPNGNDGPATSAVIGGPSDVALGPDGSLYIAAEENHRVWRVDTSGTARIIAGTGNPGFAGDGGPATAALLRRPRSVAVDSSGNVYIGDSGNNKIRRVDAATQNIITLAPSTGHPNFTLSDMAIFGDALYFTDGHRVKAMRLVDGQVNVIAGKDLNDQGFACSDPIPEGSPPLDACPILTSGLALTPDGTLYVSTRGNDSILRITPDRTQVFSVTTGTAEVGFDWPHGLAVDTDGILYIADRYNHRIHRFAGGVLMTIAGSGPKGQGNGGFAGDGGPALAARLNAPQGIVMDGQGNLYVADKDNNRVRKIGDAASFCPTCPPNDNVQNAQEIVGEFGAVTGSNTGATRQSAFPFTSSGEPKLAGQTARRTVWFKWKAPFDGDAFFWTEAGFDTVLSVAYENPQHPLVKYLPVASNDDTSPPDDRTSFLGFRAGAHPNVTYYIAVDGFNGAAGDFKVNWAIQPASGTTFPIDGVAPRLVPVKQNATLRIKAINNVTQDTTASMNGKPLTVRFVDTSTIDVDVPANLIGTPGTYDVRLKDGSFVSVPAEFQVTQWSTFETAPGGTGSHTVAGTPGKPYNQISVGVTNNSLQTIPATLAAYGPCRDDVGAQIVLGALSSFLNTPDLNNCFSTGVRAQAGVQVNVQIKQASALGQIARSVGGAGELPVSAAAPLFAEAAGAIGSVVDLGFLNNFLPPGVLSNGGQSPLQTVPAVPWEIVRGSGGAAPTVTESVENEVAVRTLSVTFDDTSTPRVTELENRLFTTLNLIYGDVNYDRTIDVQDAILVLQQVVGLTALNPLQLEAGDVAPKGQVDGAVDVQDAVGILRYIVGLP